MLVRRLGRDQRQTMSHLLFHKVMGGFELLRRVVGDTEHRQRRGALAHPFWVDPGQAGIDRPDALLLPQVHPVVHRISLARVYRQTAGQVTRRLFKAFVVFQYAAQVVQRHQHKGTVLVRCGHVLDHPAPLLQCVVQLSHALVQGAKVEVRLHKTRKDFNRPQVSSLGLTQIASVG